MLYIIILRIQIKSPVLLSRIESFAGFIIVLLEDMAIIAAPSSLISQNMVEANFAIKILSMLCLSKQSRIVGALAYVYTHINSRRIGFRQ